MVNSAYMEANGSFIYADFELLAMADDICSSKPCSGTERCISLTHGVYTCVTTECSDPLPSLHGASISGGLRNNGSVRTYQCPDRQRTVGDAQIKCNRLQWTTPSFTCNFVTDCTQLQLCDDSYTDGEYWLYPDALGNVPVKIYCRNLDATDAAEYITVDPDVNHSYNKEANQIDDSRYNFTKIGITIGTDDVTVNADDFSFILQSGSFDPGLEYGVAMSCACGGCAPGHFSINTTITGLIIDPSLAWKLVGAKPAMVNFVRSSDRDAISANCGGDCGVCMPERKMKLQINLKHVMDFTKATVPSCKQG